MNIQELERSTDTPPPLVTLTSQKKKKNANNLTGSRESTRIAMGPRTEWQPQYVAGLFQDHMEIFFLLSLTPFEHFFINRYYNGYSIFKT